MSPRPPPTSGRRKRFLTPAEERAFREAWERGCPQHECARAAGIPYSLVRPRLRDQLADLERRGRGGRGHRRRLASDPTPEEIEAMKDELQSKWSDEDRERQWHAWPD